MSDIDNVIKRVKEEIEFAYKGEPIPLYCEHLIEDVVAIIAELGKVKTDFANYVKEQTKYHSVFMDCDGAIEVVSCPKCQELETANKRIAELERKIDEMESGLSMEANRI